MSNKGIGSKKKHGYNDISIRRKTSSVSTKNNKAKARERREALREKHGLAC